MSSMHWRVGPLSHRSTSIHHPCWSSGSLTNSWPRASPTTLTLLIFGHFTLLFSLFSYSVMLLCFYSVTCLCCFLFNPIRLGFRLFVSEMIFFPFFGNFYSTVTMYLNLYGFFGSLFRCLLRVFVLLMIVSIKFRCGKGFLRLHLQIIAIFTCFEELVVCFD